MVEDKNKKAVSANQLLLLEIKERVEDAFETFRQKLTLDETEIEELKIDKESLQDYKSINSMKYMAFNLDKKVDYILKKSEE